ncbi:hypothetical protein C0585_04305 [Candidatus Woesearchaeota archaeon]|nr:MAG: hypothetical protein C0585_04305 [Candidatus Woesearchaeota archaeon]
MFKKDKKKKLHKRHPQHEHFEDQIAKDVHFAAHTQHRRLNHQAIYHIFTFIAVFVTWIFATIWAPTIPVRYFSIIIGFTILIFLGSHISKQDFIHK